MDHWCLYSTLRTPNSRLDSTLAWSVLPVIHTHTHTHYVERTALHCNSFFPSLFSLLLCLTLDVVQWFGLLRGGLTLLATTTADQARSVFRHLLHLPIEIHKSTYVGLLADGREGQELMEKRAEMHETDIEEFSTGLAHESFGGKRRVNATSTRDEGEFEVVQKALEITEALCDDPCVGSGVDFQMIHDVSCIQEFPFGYAAREKR